MNNERPEFSEGIADGKFLHGTVILKDGIPMPVTQILDCLRALDFLLDVKEYKEAFGKDEYYADAKALAWKQAKSALYNPYVLP